jgi:6-methylsalicylic acid synthase
MYSTSQADPCAVPVLDGAYWAGNLRRPVRLSEAVTAAAEDGHRAFLEISAHPVVVHSIGETLGERGFDDVFVGSSLRRNYPEQATLLTSLGALHCHGLAVDWTRLQPAGAPTALPPMPWQHRRHWRDAPAGGRGDGAGHDIDAHALLGVPLSVAGTGLGLWRTRLDDETRPYPGSHTIHGAEVVPAAVLLTTFLLAAGTPAGAPGVLRDVELRAPLPTATTREIQVVAEAGTVRLASRAPGKENAPWLHHASAATPAPPPDGGDGTLGAAPTAGTGGAGLPRVAPGLVTEHLAEVGVPTMAFDWEVTELFRADGRLRADVTVEQPARAPATWAPVFDAALSAAPAAFGGPALLRVVAGTDEVTVVGGAPPSRALIDVVVDPAREATADVTIADPTGRVVARLRGVRFGVLDGDRGGAAAPRQLVHEIVWPPFTPAEPAGTAPTEVVLVTGGGALADAVGDALDRAGVAHRAVGGPAELAALSPAPTASGAVLVLPPNADGDADGDGDTAEAAARGAWLLTSTLQALAVPGRLDFPRLWCLTRGVREAAGTAALADGPLWGLGRVIATEHPELWGGLIDVDPGDEAAFDLLPWLLAGTAADDVLAPRGEQVSVARLVRLDREPVRPPLRCRADGTYLVTGGLGALGLDIADWLADRGARRIVLASRTSLPARARWDLPTSEGGPDERAGDRIARIRALEARGVTVAPLALDITDLDAARAALAPDALRLPPIRGIVHAAGVLDNRFATQVDEASLRAVLRPKVDGGSTLHRLFPPGSLDFLTFFSSCGHLLGLAGQAAYGAANAFLDALATHRRAAGGGHDDTTSFGWTSWRGQGMAVNEVVDSELRARSVTAIDADEAFAAWEFAHRHGGGHLPVLRTVPTGPDTDRPPLLHGLADDDGGPQEGSATPVASFASLPPQELRSAVLAEVGSQIASEMRLPLSELDARRPLLEQGLDSVMTLVIRRRLEKRFARPLPATLLWNQPTVHGIADYLAGALGAADPAASQAAAGALGAG